MLPPGGHVLRTELLEERAVGVEDASDAGEAEHLRLCPLLLGGVARVVDQDVVGVALVAAARRDARQPLDVVEQRKQHLGRVGSAT